MGRGRDAPGRNGPGDEGRPGAKITKPSRVRGETRLSVENAAMSHGFRRDRADILRGMSEAIALRGLRKTFGPVTAVDGVDLDVRDGEFFSMLGPSGSGKTTVL